MKPIVISFSKSANEIYANESPKSATSPKVPIAKLHKKFYPLNFTLTSVPYEVVQYPTKKYKKHPAFIDEFVSFSPKSAKKATSKIETRNTFTCGFGYTDYTLETPVRDLHPPVCVDVPAVAYTRIKKRRLNARSVPKKEEVYHPNVISFSQRSKMVLYSQTPMQYLPAPAKKMKVKKWTLKPEYFRNKGGKKYENLQKPQNFEQNLKRLREIIKDPLLYEN